MNAIHGRCIDSEGMMQGMELSFAFGEFGEEYQSSEQQDTLYDESNIEHV